MSITKVGDINPTLKNVFISPKLFTSLISVGHWWRIIVMCI
jgi:hypothetical protein